MKKMGVIAVEGRGVGGVAHDEGGGPPTVIVIEVFPFEKYCQKK